MKQPERVLVQALPSRWSDVLALGNGSCPDLNAGRRDHSLGLWLARIKRSSNSFSLFRRELLPPLAAEVLTCRALNGQVSSTVSELHAHREWHMKRLSFRKRKLVTYHARITRAHTLIRDNFVKI